MQPQLGDIQKELSTLWRELSPENKQQWTEELNTIKEQHRQQHEQHHEPSPSVSGLPTATEFPQARVNRIAKLTPSVKKLSAEGARYLNLATGAALRQFTMRSVSGREHDKTLTVEDVLAMISRGGTPLRFLQECKYAITEDAHASFEERIDDELPVQVDEIDVDSPPSPRTPPRPLPLPVCGKLTNSRKGGPRTGKTAPMRTADIASFFKRA